MEARCSRCNVRKPGANDYHDEELGYWGYVTVDGTHYDVCPRCKRQLKVFLVGGAVESVV